MGTAKGDGDRLTLRPPDYGIISCDSAQETKCPRPTHRPPSAIAAQSPRPFCSELRVTFSVVELTRSCKSKVTSSDASPNTLTPRTRLRLPRSRSVRKAKPAGKDKLSSTTSTYARELQDSTYSRRFPGRRHCSSTDHSISYTGLSWTEKVWPIDSSKTGGVEGSGMLGRVGNLGPQGFI